MEESDEILRELLASEDDEWKRIPGFPGYSYNGKRVRGKYGKELVQIEDKRGLKVRVTCLNDKPRYIRLSKIDELVSPEKYKVVDEIVKTTYDSIEQWKCVEEFPMYQVSSKGKVRGPRGKILAQQNTDGYRKVKLCNKGNDKVMSVQRLVAKAFIPNPLNLKEVDHINRLRDDNNIENLRWVTRIENINNRRERAVRKLPYERNEIPGEQWKIIPGEFNYLYQISDQGRVKVSLGRITRGSQTSLYRNVTLYEKNGKKLVRGVHILVAENFLGKPEAENLIVNHKDLNKHNNCVHNLEWITRSENIEHAWKNGARNNSAVIQFSLDGKFIAKFNNGAEAAKANGWNVQRGSSAICAAARGHRKSGYGFKWKYEK